MKKTILPLLASLTLCTSALGVQAFAATNDVDPDPATAETPITATLELKDDNTDIVPPLPEPTDPDKPGGDNGTGITGRFGIAYAPSELTGSETLNDSGSQDVALTSADASITSFNVGVKDTLRKQYEWTLKAKLAWNDNYMDGTTFKGTNGEVSENEDGVLKNKGTVAGIKNVIGSDLEIDDTEKSIFKADGTATTNGVYNYGFENPKLNIPEVGNVPAGSYDGTITWNLELAPTTPNPAP
ncbi:WxL domain-containing protein [Enterococcus mundtii]|uniref:WxL domain-containing protein n=1 Tax=Enterococcus mundtii TaxID=53346 RepID=A0A848N0J5_ENTMU|nr:WxL domain-containing protein [Enterococcus mundtii]NMP59541.1 hypothetical protein [Enterococcus mundtii]